MNKLIITQNNTPEVVSTAVISKLYAEARKTYEGGGDLNLEGFVYVDHAKKSQVDWLTSNTNLQVIVTGEYYLDFEDPVMEEVILTKFGITTPGITKDYFTKVVEIVNSDFTSEQKNALITTRDLNKFTVKPKITSINASNLQNLWLNPYSNYAVEYFYFGGCPNIQNRIFCFLQSTPPSVSFRDSFVNPADIYIIRANDRNGQLNVLHNYMFAGNIKINMIYCKYTTGFNTGLIWSTIDKLVLDSSTVVPLIFDSERADTKFNKIYVPDDLLTQYQTDWSSQGANSTLIDKLHPISELQEVSLSDYDVEDMYDIPLDIQSQLAGKLIREYRQLT